MTVHIEELRVLILLVGCVVGYFVFKHGRPRLFGGQAQGPGDVVGGIGSAAAVITVLMLLFGDITGSQDPEQPAVRPPASGTQQDESAATDEAAESREEDRSSRSCDRDTRTDERSEPKPTNSSTVAIPD